MLIGLKSPTLAAASLFGSRTMWALFKLVEVLINLFCRINLVADAFNEVATDAADVGTKTKDGVTGRGRAVW